MASTNLAHTPGPWILAHSGYANSPFVIFAGPVRPDFRSTFPLSGVNFIAEIFHDESEQHEEQAANARLIAAAPDLVTALGALCDACDLFVHDNEEALAIAPAYEHALEVIARLRGEQ